MPEKPPLVPEIIDEEREKSMEDPEYGFNVALDSATIIFTKRDIDQEDLQDLVDEIMDKVEGLDGLDITEYGELKVYTKFGDIKFWEVVIPEIKQIIKSFLDDLPLKE